MRPQFDLRAFQSHLVVPESPLGTGPTVLTSLSTAQIQTPSPYRRLKHISNPSFPNQHTAPLPQHALAFPPPTFKAPVLWLQHGPPLLAPSTTYLAAAFAHFPFCPQSPASRCIWPASPMTLSEPNSNVKVFLGSHA